MPEERSRGGAPQRHAAHPHMRVHLHALSDAQGGQMGEGGASRMFPEGGENDVTCMALTKEFLIYGTRRGTLTYFYLPDFVPISEFRHDRGVAKLFPNELGTRLVFIDDTAAGFVYNPVNEQVHPVPEMSATTVRVMWDAADWGVFVAAEPKAYSVYVHSAHSVKGASVWLVGSMKRPTGSSPVLVHDGVVTAQSANGTISHTTLSTHEAIAHVAQRGGAGIDKLKTCFEQNVKLLRLACAAC